MLQYNLKKVKNAFSRMLQLFKAGTRPFINAMIFVLKQGKSYLDRKNQEYEENEQKMLFKIRMEQHEHNIRLLIPDLFHVVKSLKEPYFNIEIPITLDEIIPEQPDLYSFSYAIYRFSVGKHEDYEIKEHYLLRLRKNANEIINNRIASFRQKLVLNMTNEEKTRLIQLNQPLHYTYRVINVSQTDLRIIFEVVIGTNNN